MAKITEVDSSVMLQLADRLSKSVGDYQYRLNDAITSNCIEDLESLRVELEQINDNVKLINAFIDRGLSTKRLKTVDEVLSSFSRGELTVPMD